MEEGSFFSEDIFQGKNKKVKRDFKSAGLQIFFEQVTTQRKVESESSVRYVSKAHAGNQIATRKKMRQSNRTLFQKFDNLLLELTIVAFRVVE